MDHSECQTKTLRFSKIPAVWSSHLVAVCLLFTEDRIDPYEKAARGIVDRQGAGDPC